MPVKNRPFDPEGQGGVRVEKQKRTGRGIRRAGEIKLKTEKNKEEQR